MSLPGGSLLSVPDGIHAAESEKAGGEPYVLSGVLPSGRPRKRVSGVRRGALSVYPFGCGEPGVSGRGGGCGGAGGTCSGRFS